MNSSLLQRCELFITNRNTIKETFPWDGSYMYPLCASIFTSKNMTADSLRMKECRTLLKEKTGVFSNFRGVCRYAITAMLTVDEHPEEKINNALKAYEMLKNEFYTSAYLPVASILIADTVPSDQYEEVTLRTRRIYNLMKKEHPFLTSREDCIYATLLAFSKETDEYLLNEMERCYEILKPKFFTGNAVQSLSHVLTLEQGSSEGKCRRVVDLYDTLKNNGLKYGTNYELPILGILALLNIDISTIVHDITEVDQYLKNQKGFGIFGITTKQRLMYAGMLIADEYFSSSNQAMSMSAINGTISIVLAQQAATCSAIAASSAAAASASSSS